MRPVDPIGEQAPASQEVYDRLACTHSSTP